MLRAFGVKVVAALWAWSCLRFLPAPLGAGLATIGIVAALAFLIQAVCRPASQFLLPVIHRGPQRREVALTFDDGPDPEVTPRILDLLAEHSATATFFVVGERAARYPELVRRMVAEGHDVGTHTQSHRVAFHFGTRTFVHREVQDAIDGVANILGKTPRFFRPPQGLRTPLSARVLRQYRGLDVFTWTERAKDSRNTTHARIDKRLSAALAPGAILTLHDGKGFYGGHDREPTLAAVRTLLERCRARELRCVGLSALVGASAFGAVHYDGVVAGSAIDRERYPLKYRLPLALYAPYRLVRAALTGIMFAIFWIGALLFVSVALPVAALCGGFRMPRTERMRRNQAMLRRCFLLFHAAIRALRLVDSRAVGALPARGSSATGGRVLVSNHATLVDMTAIVAAYPDVVCVAKSTYARNFVVGRLLRACGFVSAGEGALSHQQMIDQCQDRLRRGFDVLVFPEGTRSLPGELHPFRRGAFEVACRAKADVVLLFATAKPSALTKGLPFWRHPDRSAVHRIEPLRVVTPAAFDYRSRRMCRAVEEIFQERVRACGSEPQAEGVGP